MFERYSRQTIIREIGFEGQKRISSSCVLLIGCGALGSVIAPAIVRTGVGMVKIADRDFIEYHNLQRQILFDENENFIGRHKFIIYYTVGQRKGVGIQSPRSLYVSRIDAEKNGLVISEMDLSTGLIAGRFNLIAVDRLEGPFRATVKIRLQHQDSDAIISHFDHNKVKILFNET